MSHVDDLRGRGFTIVTEDELGYPGLHKRIGEAFFNEAALPPRPDIEGPVPTRYRNKDFLHYRRIGQALDLRETTADRFARIRIPGDPPWRPIPRFTWTQVPGAAEVAAALLNMVPDEDRHEEGTFGLHGFRSFSQVVAEPHADGFEFGGTYVIDRTTGGAVSYLHDMRKDGQLVMTHQLEPGEILLFHERYRDQPPMFLHGATPLEPGGHRDALVIQFDAPEDLAAAAEEHADGGAW